MEQNKFDVLLKFVGRYKGKKPGDSTKTQALQIINTGSSDGCSRNAQVLASRILEADETLKTAGPGINGTIALYFSINVKTSVPVILAVREVFEKNITCSSAAVESQCNSMPVYCAVKSIKIMHSIREEWEALNG